MTAEAGDRDWFISTRRTVLCVDMVESVRLIEEDEVGTITRWRDIVAHAEGQLLPAADGRLVKSHGDGMLLELPTVAAALRVAFGLNRVAGRLNADRAPGDRVEIRMGLEIGDVIVDRHDIYGHGVNLAARFAALGHPGDLVCSAAVRDEIVDGLDAQIEDLGECFLKHVRRPQRAYRLTPPDAAPRLRRAAAAVQALLPTLAVIPFRVQGADAGAATGQVVAEELIRTVSQSPHLNVISRLSTAAFAQADPDLQRIADLLEASHAVTGTLTAEGGRIALSLELSETRKGHVLWADRAEFPLDSLFRDDREVIGRLAQGIARAILSHELNRARALPARTLESYTLLLAAIHAMYRLAGGDFRRARDMLEAVIERNPRHSVPLAWMGNWHVLKVQQGWTADLGAERREAEARTARALDLNPDCEQALTMDGLVQTVLGKAFDTAESRYAGALAVNPSNALSNLYKASMHAFRDEGEIAVDLAERALAASPLDPQRYLFDCLAAVAYISAHRPEEGLIHAERSLKANATHTSTLRTLAIAQWQVGRRDEARATVQKLTALEPTLTVSRWQASNPAAGFAMGRMIADILREAGVPD